jgi:hypothetical protein
MPFFIAIALIVVNSDIENGVVYLIEFSLGILPSNE